MLRCCLVLIDLTLLPVLCRSGGKSTLLRQTCTTVILAQVGCWVPAQSCRLTPVDRIFTRVGAADRIMQGQSTFLVSVQQASKLAAHARLSLRDVLSLRFRLCLVCAAS